MHRLHIRHLDVWYGTQPALRDISLEVPPGQITAIIGPSGCGKTTLLKSMNRLVETSEQVRVRGQVLLDEQDIYAPEVDVTDVRTRIGLLPQKPFPLPLSIYDNVAYGARLHGLARGGELRDLVERTLQAVRLWEEVQHRLHDPAQRLSVGQQQRLCLARALAVQPDVLLCDESTSALDPLAARGIEELLAGLRPRYTILMVTHNIDQARRLADYVALLWLGELVEHGPATQFFQQPRHPLTRSYLAGECG